ncbi:hypothetical protein K402DRAFT_418552 [Aulographum hederae CBS 113979]|uniref:Arrestin-like N-terminal domain-containing protein n=1 Tax=Aulographum hederae CBS 113979 TaxID=1176131 RepID=A0A6G1H9Z8_9PEZI|nr:hypothetical protein K402DRAFT_418552 [Aulographum hederae CBS 113979]
MNGTVGNITKVKIMLVGHIQNIGEFGENGTTQPQGFKYERTCLKLVDVQDASCALSDPDWEDVQHFSFFFQFPREAVYEKNCPPALPSTVAVGPWATTSTQMAYRAVEARVRYQLQASAYCNDIVQATAAYNICLYDSIDQLPPPVIVEHYGSDYILRREKALKSMLRRQQDRLAISAEEPRPVEVKRGGNTPAIAIPLRLAIHGSSSPPGNVKLKVECNMQTTTFISLAEMKHTPSIQQAEESPYIQDITTAGRLYIREAKLSPSDWSKAATKTTTTEKSRMNTSFKHPTTTTTTVTEITPTIKPTPHTATTTLFLPLLESTMPPPTFFTSHLARRYSVALHIRASSDSGSATFKLNVPLQIVYLPDAMTTPGVEEWEEDPLEVVMRVHSERGELPIYVK